MSCPLPTSPTKSNPTTLGSALYFFSPLMRSVLLQPCQYPRCLELTSKPGAGLIIGSTRSRDMSSFKTQDKHVSSAKPFTTQNQILSTPIDLKHALQVKDVQKCFATQQCCDQANIVWPKQLYRPDPWEPPSFPCSLVGHSKLRQSEWHWGIQSTPVNHYSSPCLSALPPQDK